MRLLCYISWILWGSVLGNRFVEIRVNGGHRPYCGRTLVLSSESSSLRNMFVKLGRKSGHIAEKVHALYVTYDDERIETPLNQTNLPHCLTKIVFEDYPGTSVSRDSLIDMLKFDMQSLLQADGILREMRTEENQYDEGIYSPNFDEILVRISRTICEIHKVLRLLRADHLTDNSPFYATMCSGKCRQARYHRDVHILMKMNQFTLSLRNKYTNLSTLFPLL